MVPQRFGSGVKSKTTEAMSLGLPIVTSSVGAEGTGLEDGLSASITDDPQVFAERVIELYTRPDLWLEFAKRAFALASERFSKKAVKPLVAEMLDSLAG